MGNGQGGTGRSTVMRKVAQSKSNKLKKVIKGGKKLTTKKVKSK